MLKKDARKQYLEKRMALTKAEVQLNSQQIFEQFLSGFPVQKDNSIHIFQSIPKFNEVETAPFIRHFLEMGVSVFVPKMSGTELMTIEITPRTEMALNSWGIMEPVSDDDAAIRDYDYVITPLLYCDAEGNRVGYGKGFYDRFFAGISPSAKKIGVGFFPPADLISDVNEADVSLDYLVTPTAVLSFGS